MFLCPQENNWYVFQKRLFQKKDKIEYLCAGLPLNKQIQDVFTIPIIENMHAYS